MILIKKKIIIIIIILIIIIIIIYGKRTQDVINIEIHVCSRNQDIYTRSRAKANTEHDNKQQRHCDEINGISRKGISNFTLTEWKLD